MSIARTDMRLQSRSTDLLGTALRLSTLALAAVAISANFTNYGPLIPLLQRELHISSGVAGLLSTLLYIGIGLSYLPGGWLADRYGSRRVLFGALLLVGAGGCLLPLISDLVWIVLCRFVIGLGAGAAIVAGSQAARQGTNAAFGQGFFGGAMQFGAGLGLFATPTLLDNLGWRGAFTAWGLLGLAASALCLLALSGEARPRATAAPRRISEAFRSPSLLSHRARSPGNAGTRAGDCALAGGLLRPLLRAAVADSVHAGSGGPADRNALSSPGWHAALAQGLHPQCADAGGNSTGLRWRGHARSSPAHSAGDRVGAGPVCLRDNVSLCCHLRRGRTHWRGERPGNLARLKAWSPSSRLLPRLSGRP